MIEKNIDTSQLGAITVYTEDADPTQLRVIWKNSGVILLFIRHFG